MASGRPKLPTPALPQIVMAGGKMDIEKTLRSQHESIQALVERVLQEGKQSGAAALDEKGLLPSAKGGVPPGAFMGWSSDTAPEGWLLCDGKAYTKNQYPNLYAVIGAKWGGSGESFNVPDFRGRFLRGVDNGAGRDPDAAGRTAMAAGGASGDNVGSVQLDAMQGHKHETPSFTSSVSGIAAGVNYNLILQGAATGNPLTDGVNGTPRTSSETRPLNASAWFIIKT